MTTHIYTESGTLYIIDPDAGILARVTERPVQFWNTETGQYEDVNDGPLFKHCPDAHETPPMVGQRWRTKIWRNSDQRLPNWDARWIPLLTNVVTKIQEMP